VADAAMTLWFGSSRRSTASRAPAIRRKTILNSRCSRSQWFFSISANSSTELAVSLWQDSHRSAQVPNDHAVLLGGRLIVRCQFSQCGRFCGG